MSCFRPFAKRFIAVSRQKMRWRALTVTPAELFGVDDRLGTIEPGKLASLIVTDGDIFAKKTKIHETWVDGQRSIYERDSIDVRGVWNLKLTGEGPPRALEIVVKGSKRKLNGRVKTDDKPVKLRAVKFSGTQLSFDIPTKHWQRHGVTRISLIVDQDELADHEFLGKV